MALGASQYPLPSSTLCVEDGITTCSGDKKW